jgi:hypothetical protein
LVKEENGDLFADFHNISYRHYFSQLLNVLWINDIRQTEKHIDESLVLEPSSFQVESVIKKLKSYKSPGNDKIPAQVIKAGGKILLSEIHKFNSM